jgi:hypothetical protein
VPGDFFAEVPDAMRIHKRGMRAIMRALKEHDGATAEHEFIAMLAQEGESVVALLIERGLIGGSD